VVSTITNFTAYPGIPASRQVIDAACLIPLPWTREQVMDHYVSFGVQAADGQELTGLVLDDTA
jgi:hypothetical protein